MREYDFQERDCDLVEIAYEKAAGAALREFYEQFETGENGQKVLRRRLALARQARSAALEAIED